MFLCVHMFEERVSSECLLVKKVSQMIKVWLRMFTVFD